MFRWNRDGVTREVILTKRFAFKLPKLTYGWRCFLQGLLANMQERTFAKTRWPELCPILFSIPGGFLSVMPRAEPLTDDEWNNFDWDKFTRPNPSSDEDDINDYYVPVENKQCSFGKLNGRIVAVDYGS